MTGVLLINLGTPGALTEDAVREYLDEFLMDPFVVDIPKPLRWLLVKKIILPKRPAQSLEQYKKIWTEKGSPLMVHHMALTKKVQDSLGNEFLVRGAMRYGSPSIASELATLKEKGATKLILFPLYPQYSLAATESSLVCAREWLKNHWPDVPTQEIESFYADPEFIKAFVDVGRPLQEEGWDHTLFSYHGLPQRQIRRVSQGICFKDDCCAAMSDRNIRCYRAQSFETTRQIAKALGLKKEDYSVGFQSRLGVTSWIRPYTDEVVADLGKRGVRRLLIWVPSFVADCLETLEEITIRATETFQEAGGETLKLVPSLNASQSWVDAVCHRIRSL